MSDPTPGGCELCGCASAAAVGCGCQCHVPLPKAEVPAQPVFDANASADIARQVAEALTPDDKCAKCGDPGPIVLTITRRDETNAESTKKIVETRRVTRRACKAHADEVERDMSAGK
jgi:hypothetical protein